MKSSLLSQITVTTVLAGCSLLAIGTFAADEGKISSPGNTNFPPAKAGVPVPGTGQVREQLTTAEFAHKAAIGGQKEVLLSEMALSKSANPSVKEFARHMVHDHSAANRELMRIAQAGGITIPPTNAFESAVNSYNSAATARNYDNTEAANTHDPTTRRGAGADAMGRSPTAAEYRILDSDLEVARKLERLSGAEFDRAYVKEMIKDHDKTIGLFQTAARTQNNEDLRQFAANTLPKLYEHSRRAEQLGQDIRAFTDVRR